ncbi:hypothetical protein KCTC52924_01973 [Arenibacter antarcticus]|uniref:Endonuclease/exonuclease/phosphatase family protein n=1 Tax=Arenibacter antarcticus TaxID=2040469 RepID=A0ABW5VC84_9FLAO|nr:endonuclease/exonuclease/phosphatase family protein [Arenibacter sp. H213]MCM4168401.1 hypothetical protein [Arenibacter sp. H213]
MKVATWNIENLYHRDKGLSRSNLGKCASDWILELDALMPRIQKSENDMARIRELTFLLGFENIDTHPYAVMRKRNGGLFLKQRDFANESKASRLTDWNGWVALQTVAVDHKSTLHKARLIAEIDADILVLQEVEDKPSLMEFNRMLKDFNIASYDQVMVLEGNDDRGLSMAIMTKNGYRLDTVRCHTVDIADGRDLTFETDCQEYAIITPKEETVFILSTQFSGHNTAKRKLQAREVAAIYDKLKVEGKERVLVCGTLNDVSYSDCLSPILRETDLEDISRLPMCEVDKDKGKAAGYFRLGAYRKGVNIKQKDYMLLSYEMSQKIITCGINRKAMWPERNMKWEVYPTLKNREHAASAHPLIWGEFDIW